MPRLRRVPAVIGLAATFLAVHMGAALPPAHANGGQMPIIEDDQHVRSDPTTTLALFRLLGARVVRFNLTWSDIAPNATSTRKPAFDATDPGSYPAANWAPYDAIVRAAAQDGIAADFILGGGAPRWAESGNPPGGYNSTFAWWPSASAYGQFAHAALERYSGTYAPSGVASPLPAVHFWTIWNEPNFGEDLGPQAINGSRTFVAPMTYRNLVDAAWSALQSFSSHRNDTVLFGETAPHGAGPTPPHRGAPQGNPGNYGQTKPLQFVRWLYCVDSKYQQLRGRAASSVGCPTNGAGSRSFRRNNPGLFEATGFGAHPYPFPPSATLPPTTDGKSDPDFAAFSELGRLGRMLDRLQRIYGSGKRFGVYNDEYGYQTHPPHAGNFVSPTTGAYYINWAEYLSWRSGRIASSMQYLVWDPPASKGPYNGFASGLFFPNGQPKPAYSAYRLPLYLPHTSTHRGWRLEVWGAARPAPFAAKDTKAPQYVNIQFQRNSRGAFTTVQQVKITSPQGYFDVKVRFPSSGTVRLTWTYPVGDPLFPSYASGATVYSRHVNVTLR
jgi:hypothetical protein